MKLRLSVLFVALSCLFGCEAVGPNDIATWKIFHGSHARVVYTSVVPEPSTGERISPRIDPQPVETVVSPERSLPAEVDARTTTYGYAEWDVGIDADFQKLLNPALPTLKDFTELGPLPAFPIIDIAVISEALTSKKLER